MTKEFLDVTLQSVTHPLFCGKHSDPYYLEFIRLIAVHSVPLATGLVDSPLQCLVN